MDYAIRDNLYCCSCAGRVVLLDTRADRYFLVPEDLGSAFLRLWNSEPAEERDVQDFDRLESTGVLVTGPSKAQKDLTRRTILPASSDFTSFEQIRVTRVEAARAGLYQLKAWLRIRTRPIVNVLGELSQIHTDSHVKGEEADAQLLRVATAFRATAGIFKQHNQCLPRSIAFKRMCEARGLEATLIIGVTLDPFSAHSWVQSGDRVINDTLERVRCFTPIFAA